MRSALLLLIPSVALGTDLVGYEASLRTEQQVRVFTGEPGGAPTTPLEFFPTITGIRRVSQTNATLSYLPQLLFGTNGPTSPPALLHQGRLFIEQHFASDRRLTLTEQGAYGTVDFLTFVTSQFTTPGGAPPRLLTLPSVRPLQFGNTNTQLTFEYGFDKRTRMILDASYLYGGGIGDGRSVLPLQRQPQGSVSVVHQATRSDSLTTQGQFSRSDFSSGQSADIGILTERWRRRVDLTTEFQLALGPSALWATASAGARPVLVLFPAGEALFRTLGRASGHRIEVEAAATLGPYMDWVTGVGYERLDLSVTGRWIDAQDRWGGLARARGGTSVASTQPGQQQSLAILELSALYAPRSDLRVEAGSRLLWQRVPQFGPQPFWEWLTFVSLTVSARGIL